MLKSHCWSDRGAWTGQLAGGQPLVADYDLLLLCLHLFFLLLEMCLCARLAVLDSWQTAASARPKTNKVLGGTSAEGSRFSSWDASVSQQNKLRDCSVLLSLRDLNHSASGTNKRDWDQHFFAHQTRAAGHRPCWSTHALEKQHC